LQERFGANRAYVHLENYDLQEVFISNTNSISQGNNVLDTPASNIDGFLYRDHVFLQLSEQAYLEQNETFSTFKTMIFSKYSFQKLTQFSQENKVLPAAATNIDGNFGGIHVFLQLSRTGLFGTK
jgi:hypothetical protein